ncbi:hypothetical protein J2S04_000789 [Alicyclobacillus tengchongensis]|uniref:Uncharacterized protein n=1 Tax=Alicyclobacillus tolerans TaxID=90970 RepID=A0ABT9LUB1_9BACL|nr:hypothetical protein [Alicyclobacillus tengchongensis]
MEERVGQSYADDKSRIRLYRFIGDVFPQAVRFQKPFWE